jgi:hypothetical protein
VNYNDLIKGLDFDNYSLEKITDLKKIENYNKIIEEGKELPNNIVEKIIGSEPVSNETKYAEMEKLPKNIVKKNLQVENEQEISKINDFKDRNTGSLPTNIKSSYINVEGERVLTYFYKNKFKYRKNVYEFYNKVPIKKEDLSLMISLKNAKSMNEIANVFVFYKTLTIVALILYGVSLLFILTLLT